MGDHRGGFSTESALSSIERTPYRRAFFERTALSDLLEMPRDKINEDRSHRALDQLLPYKEALEQHLKERKGVLFRLEYDLYLYDVTSTYFEATLHQSFV